MDIRTRIIWQSDERYAVYRIPGMIFTAKGTILIYCEARDALSDWARMDILLYRSEDGGDTFSGPVVMARGTEDHPTVDNPVCIPGPDGLLHFLYCRDYSVEGGGVWYRRSDDDGLTWSDPVSLMDRTCPALHNAFAFGPGHGIALENGTLLVPVWYVPKAAGAEIRSHHPACVSVFFSTDNGETWRLGDRLCGTAACPDPNETAAAQAPDGSVFFSVRLGGRTGCRAVTRSLTGFSGFEPLTLCPALPDPVCMGSAVRAEDTLLSVNCASTTARENLVVRTSFDGGRTWPRSLVVESGDAGYADIAYRDGTVYVIYEQRAGETVKLARFALRDIL